MQNSVKQQVKYREIWTVRFKPYTCGSYTNGASDDIGSSFKFLIKIVVQNFDLKFLSRKAIRHEEHIEIFLGHTPTGT